MHEEPRQNFREYLELISVLNPSRHCQLTSFMLVLPRQTKVQHNPGKEVSTDDSKIANLLPTLTYDLHEKHSDTNHICPGSYGASKTVAQQTLFSRLKQVLLSLHDLVHALMLAKLQSAEAVSTVTFVSNMGISAVANICPGS